MKKSILLGLILSLLIVLPVFAQDPIKIGVYGPMSGDSAMVGQTLLEGVQLATKQINEHCTFRVLLEDFNKFFGKHSLLSYKWKWCR